MLKVTTCLKLVRHCHRHRRETDEMDDGRELSLLDKLDERLVGRDRGRAGGETEDERSVGGRREIVYAAEGVSGWVYKAGKRQTA